MTGWHRHPGVRSGGQLTTGERAADLIRNGLGSWPFVITFLATCAVWAAINTFARFGGGRRGFDPYPYILLNLVLSTLAGLQGAILLIAAKRADQVASELAMHTYETARQILANQDAMMTAAEKTLTLLADLRRLAAPGGDGGRGTPDSEPAAPPGP